jgi:hypothetical protein
MFLLQLLSPRVLVCNNRQAPSAEVEPQSYSAKLETGGIEVILEDGPIKVTAYCPAGEAQIEVEINPDADMYFSEVIALETGLNDSPIDVTIDRALKMNQQYSWFIKPRGNDVLIGAIAIKTNYTIHWEGNLFGVQENSEFEAEGKCALTTLRYRSPNTRN